ncbi:MAG: TrmH family RNA methyltransferase [Flavobacteriaceae bacterium]
MLTSKDLKRFKKLHQKKHRLLEQLFIAEGVKVVEEFIAEGFRPINVFADHTYEGKVSTSVYRVASKQMEQLSAFKKSPGLLAVFEMQIKKKLNFNGWTVALDSINDPGNLGTIIRTCDWFGIDQILCSSDTVDCYNPKVVQASMGSLARVNCYYGDLGLELKSSGQVVFAADLKGECYHEVDWPESGILLMGSESHGISPSLKNTIHRFVHIPKCQNSRAESLNVGVSASILLSALQK